MLRRGGLAAQPLAGVRQAACFWQAGTKRPGVPQGVAAMRGWPSAATRPSPSRHSLGSQQMGFGHTVSDVYWRRLHSRTSLAREALTLVRVMKAAARSPRRRSACPKWPRASRLVWYVWDLASNLDPPSFSTEMRTSQCPITFWARLLRLTAPGTRTRDRPRHGLYG